MYGKCCLTVHYEETNHKESILVYFYVNNMLLVSQFNQQSSTKTCQAACKPVKDLSNNEFTYLIVYFLLTNAFNNKLTLKTCFQCFQLSQQAQ